ncbi:hypothetical protein TTHERM_00016070 (macronuclear) [Tetrahymena thermophila SB210]|uniref:Uncharacterized protein n=1 Tax=Tetrahymena thermophila (strain SB210) TaxID=312017 RepID=Q22RI0_TETTS|nr:hypothetical protein TTHERM_00016070 [Tetrahymena thermophila SB210]EAR88142.1 hypothetical protein TTHERM_00016070 [Tetrahymena thermophila SB210]|eukprot:XP_001008387.1 hypothetical protein TTHERM_00016070 [Tetrahymena thermophila SB210]
MDQNTTYEFLKKKQDQTDFYYKDVDHQFKEYRKTDQMMTLFLESSPSEIITVKVVVESNSPFEKIVRALQDLSYFKQITPDLEQWVIIDRNVNYEIHHCQTKAKTDMIFGEIKQISQNLAYFTSASVDHPSIVIDKDRTLTNYMLNSTVVEKTNNNQSKVTFILCQNIARFDVQTNNKILLESVPPYLEQLTKAFEKYPY